MALAITYVATPIKNAGGYKFRRARITTDASYVNGTGYTLAASDFGLNTIAGVDLGISDIGFGASWKQSTGKMKCWKVGAAGPMVECATNEATLNGAVFEADVVGY